MIPRMHYGMIEAERKPRASGDDPGMIEAEHTEGQ